MKSISYLISLNIFLLMISFCTPTSKIVLQGKGNYYDAMNNAIIDYSHKTSFNRRYSYAIINDCTDSAEDYFCFRIVPDYEKFIMDSSCVIGQLPTYGFPTHYKHMNRKLFLWRESNSIVSQDIVNLLADKNLIDSTFIKVKQGFLSKGEAPVSVIDETITGITYYVCKENVGIIKKIKKSKAEILPKSGSWCSSD